MYIHTCIYNTRISSTKYFNIFIRKPYKYNCKKLFWRHACHISSRITVSHSRFVVKIRKEEGRHAVSLRHFPFLLAVARKLRSWQKKCDYSLMTGENIHNSIFTLFDFAFVFFIMFKFTYEIWRVYKVYYTLTLLSLTTNLSCHIMNICMGELFSCV